MDAAHERILIVDGEEKVAGLCQRALLNEGYEVEHVSSGEEALDKIEKEWFDLVIAEPELPGMSGLELLTEAKRADSAMPFIFVTGFATVDSAVLAMKEGADDFFTKPVDIERLKEVVKKALELHRLTGEVQRLRRQLEQDWPFEQLVGRSKPMRQLFRLMAAIGKRDVTVLIEGESGTGKELIAKAIHQISPRSSGPFVAVACGAMPETLLESELFGYVRGAFTGAIGNKRGLFEEAQGGTLLLDEIGDTTPAMQLKLLRVLQEREIRPIGSRKVIPVDVRVIAATNKDLKKEVQKGTLREDLYYRLAVIPLVPPPLRERKEDIPLLVDRFIKKYCRQNDMAPKRITVKGLQALMDYAWPGNVRELEHVLERAILLSPGDEMAPGTLFPIQSIQSAEVSARLPLRTAAKTVLAAVEREKIALALDTAKGKRSAAARILGISRASLYDKLKRYHLVH
ncbi:MAG: sigma-54-dependent Fis family transcriptional regulator [Deltaproteobacteria bacterium]|nr:sigma-54-dependent Fis family transcriptional regulator [Deltaproteobacteria bacterium]MBI2365088.1 sigma-54-dependent Fis family transcriptional regulator [Deltaproteobacteria bacterium]MBI2533830.1 sigma-54-dependent Fis family transcriptional regulator [Deltaproteobacteria bacterium]MBI3066650.1 sigma-54-dependent Fis family transcriptional regulator [Deltaproteobacteria bacterium]